MLQINPGEVWLTRDGKKARIYAINGRGRRPIHGAKPDGDEDAVIAWTATGQYWAQPVAESDHDLICKYDWREELRPIWAVLKPEWRAVAMDENGTWGAYTSAFPQRTDTKFCGKGYIELSGFRMPTPDCPWYGTLTERP